MRIKSNALTNVILLLFAALAGISVSFGQEESSKEKIVEYQTEVRQMVSFLEFSLNVIGDSTVSVKEKDIIINESYLKFFKDDKVQIEDDLDENRDVVINKDVQAYLKDVDFFFKQVQFEFNILDIANDVNHDGDLFFTVKMMRNLKGITVAGDSINSDKERYIEVNVDEESRDFKIASIYTTKLSRNEELTIWWSGLDLEWRTLLGVDIEVKEGLRLSEIQEFSDTTYVVEDMQVVDSIQIIDFVKIAASKEVMNLSGSKIITHLKPLGQLKNLKKLDISSSDIVDLFPIRNLTTIEILDCSNTMVENLQPLKYSRSLRELLINNTPVTSITVIENFENLEVLHLEQTVIDSLPAINKLVNLIDLNCANTNLIRLDSVKHLKSLYSLNFSNTIVEDLGPISDLKHLKKVDLSHTNVTSLASLAKLKNLEEVAFEYTDIDDLSALNELEHLRIIYADHAKVDMSDFIEFALLMPEVEIVFMTDKLFSFWDNLDEHWKGVVSPKLEFSDTVTKVDIHRITRIKKLDISGNSDIADLSPLEYMPLLEELNFSETQVSDLSPLNEMDNLKVLIGSNSKVIDLSPTKGMSSLTKIDFDHTEINNISPLSDLTQLDSIFFNQTKVKDLKALNAIDNFKAAYFEDTQVTDEDVLELEFDESKSVVVYKSEKLRSWWGNVDDQWQNIFRELDGLSDRPSNEQLHKLASKRSLDVNGTSLKNLNALTEMVRLESLDFTDTRINSLYPLVGLKNIEVLRCPRNPISDIEGLTSMGKLKILDLDNTQVSDLKAIRSLSDLKELKFSGTNVKDISPVEELSKLEVLEFSKTRVKNINSLSSLGNLKVLKCYNNKISSKKIEEFKDNNPDCEVVFY